MLDVALLTLLQMTLCRRAHTHTHTHTHGVWPDPSGHSNASKDACNTVLQHSTPLLKTGYWMHAAKPCSAKAGGKQ